MPVNASGTMRQSRAYIGAELQQLRPLDEICACLNSLSNRLLTFYLGQKLRITAYAGENLEFPAMSWLQAKFRIFGENSAIFGKNSKISGYLACFSFALGFMKGLEFSAPLSCSCEWRLAQFSLESLRVRGLVSR